MRARRATPRQRPIGRIVGVIIAASALVGCGGSGGSPSTPPVELTILAAASLHDALVGVGEAWERDHPGTRLLVTTDSSAALETKIEQGARADVFLSADTTNPRKLAAGGFVAGEPIVFAANTLIIVVPTAGAGIQAPYQLAVPGVKIIAAADGVPITAYAHRVLANLTQVPGYPPDLAAKYEANIVSREENVRAVIAKIELGEGDAAIVYVTDARASGRVAEVKIPDSANVRAEYAGVVLESSTHEDVAADFLSWLSGIPGQSQLTKFGFLPVPG